MNNCEGCGATIPPQAGPGKPRTYCAECRPPRNRGTPRVVIQPAPVVDLAPAHGGLAEHYRRELDRRGVLDTPQAALVLELARTLAEGGHTASGVAQLGKALMTAREDALKHAPRVGDAVDQLQQMRRRIIREAAHKPMA